MRLVHLTLKKNKGPLYLQIAEAIRKAITNGRMLPGERLPSSRSLAESLKTNKLTVMAGLEELISEGWIVAEPRRGYRVHDVLPSKFFSPQKGTARKTQRIRKWSHLKTVELGGFAPKSAITHNLQSGRGDLRLFPISEFRSHLNDVLRHRKSPKFLDYGDSQGEQSLQTQIKQYLRRMRSVQDRSVLITNGSQEAIDLAVRLLLKPGDTVAMAELCYPPAREAFRWAGANVVSVSMNEEGIDPDAFEKLLKRKKVHSLFLCPLHQFPTTRNLSIGARLTLYSLCSKHNVLIFEDDYDHEFHYRSHPPAPMASEDSDGRILYFSTFSKLLFPSARLGFLAAPAPLVRALAQLRRISSHQNETISQLAFSRWLQSGGLDRYVRKLRRLYENRRNVMIEQLEKCQQQGTKLSWATPEGGMALWLNVHKNAQHFAKKALSRGCFVVPESTYRFDRKPGTHLRLGFSHLNETEIKAALTTLFPKEIKEQD